MLGNDGIRGDLRGLIGSKPVRNRADPHTMLVKLQRRKQSGNLLLKLRDLREVKVADLHRRNHHVK